MSVKIAVISDVHGNRPALEAVLEDIAAWGADELIINGDLINRGPDSLGCLQLLQQTALPWLGVQGNHEAYVLRCADKPRAEPGPKFELKRFAYWTVDQLGDALGQIRSWPHHLDQRIAGEATLHITHGSRLGNRAGILPDTEGAELVEKLGERRDLFVASHTHKAFVRRFEDTLLVNTGSVGSPFDRDERAAYARLSYDAQGWQAAIRRVAFDRRAAERAFERTGFLDEAGPLARIMLTEFHHCRGHMGPWMRAYHDAVLAGEITIEQAVARYLDEVQ